MRPAGNWMYGEVFGRTNSKSWSNVLWFLASTAPGSAFDTNQLAQDLNSHFATLTQPFMASDAYLVGSKVVCVCGGVPIGGVDYSTVNGSGGAQSLPDDVCVVVRENTSTPGPAGRGRIRLAGIDEAQTDANYLNNFAVASLNTALAAWKAGFASSGITFVPKVYSRKTNTLLAITAMTADALLGTERRRRPRF